MIVVASGYFDPVHVGHIEYLNAAKALGDKLIVLVNSDDAAIRKKGYVFMPQVERIKIISQLKCVDQVIPALDDDNTVAANLEVIKPDIFAKGGDRDISNLPLQELDVCNRCNIKIVTGLGSKIASSSELVENKRNRAVKPGEMYELVHTGPGYKVRIMKLNHGNSLHQQFHNFRDEIWTVLKGKIKLAVDREIKIYTQNDVCFIPKGTKHSAENIDCDCVEILQVQLGDNLDDEDVMALKDGFGSNQVL